MPYIGKTACGTGIETVASPVERRLCSAMGGYPESLSFSQCARTLYNS